MVPTRKMFLIDHFISPGKSSFIVSELKQLSGDNWVVRNIPWVWDIDLFHFFNIWLNFRIDVLGHFDWMWSSCWLWGNWEQWTQSQKANQLLSLDTVLHSAKPCENKFHFAILWRRQISFAMISPCEDKYNTVLLLLLWQTASLEFASSCQYQEVQSGRGKDQTVQVDIKSSKSCLQHITPTNHPHKCQPRYWEAHILKNVAVHFEHVLSSAHDSNQTRTEWLVLAWHTNVSSKLIEMEFGWTSRQTSAANLLM